MNIRKKSIGIACDHAAFDVKEKLIKFISGIVGDVIDFGCHSEESVDYPDYAHRISKALLISEIDQGILICGTGIGISIAANKNKGIRAALCTSPFHAEMARKHNDANMIAFGSRTTDFDDICSMTKVFLNTDFEGGRHQRRIQKIENE